jgi:hypothetical protein
MSKINLVKLTLNKVNMAKLVNEFFKMAKLTMSKVNMVKLTNE